MTEVVLRVESVSKRYEIYDRPHDRLRQSVRGRVRRVARRVGLHLEIADCFREFWALRDVSFELRRGEALGIIGRNGAGKSTLLQIVAGVLAPTAGSVHVNGRVAALLELGSGFSPEFTGAENVRLAAALHGLTGSEIDATLESIIAFADIGDFIDQPVKTYSSGMVMRLAFAVHTAVRPDIMIVDEALSVGDVFFQAKCMAKLRQLIADGTALLFVSHDTGTVRQICREAVFLHHGLVAAAGPAADVADAYLRIELEERNRSAGAVPDPGAQSRTEAEGARSSEASEAAVAAPAEEATSASPPAGAGTLFTGRADALPAERESGRRNDIIDDPLFGRVSFLRRASVNRVGNGAAQFVNVQLLRGGRVSDLFDYGDQVILRQVARFERTLDFVNVSFKIRTPQGADIVYGDSRVAGALEQTYQGGCTYIFDWRLRLTLMHGNYCIASAMTHPPRLAGEDWTFIDFVPIAYDFRMAPRAEGMVDGFVVMPFVLDIGEAVGLACEPQAMDEQAG